MASGMHGQCQIMHPNDLLADVGPSLERLRTGPGKAQDRPRASPEQAHNNVRTCPAPVAATTTVPSATRASTTATAPTTAPATDGARGIAKSSLPLQEARLEQIAGVRAVLLKKPARSPGILRRKRTPFSLKREGSLILGGSKLAIYRGNTPSGPVKRPATKMVKKRPSAKT